MSNLELNLVQEDIVLQLGTVGPPGPSGGGADPQARAAIGWPYTDPTPLSARLTTTEGDIVSINSEIATLTSDVDTEIVDIQGTIGWPWTEPASIQEIIGDWTDFWADDLTVKSQFDTLFADVAAIVATTNALGGFIGLPYTSPSSLNSRVTALEANPVGIDEAARAAIGWPYSNPVNLNIRASTSESSITAINGTLATAVTNIGTLQTNVSALQTTSGQLSTAVGLPYTNANSLSTRVSTLESYVEPTVVGTANQITVTTVNKVNTLSLPNNVIFPNNATINGNLDVLGTLNYNNVTDLNVTDNQITLNYGVTGAPALNAFVSVERGDQPNVSVLWNESAQRWQVGQTLTQASWVNLLIPSDLNTINSTLSDYGTRITAAEGNISTLQTNVSGLQSSVSNLTTRMGTAETNISNLQTSVTSLSGRTTTLEEHMTTAEANILALQGQTTTNTNNISALTTRVTTAENNITSLQNTVAAIPTTYLTIATAASTYLTQTDAINTFLKQVDAASTYLTIANAASTYVTQSFLLANYLKTADIAATYLTQANAASTYAPIASPILTGVPAAPTAAVDTNTSQIATTSFVINQGYLKSASAASTYAPLSSPTFTGVPAAPTAAVDTNTTQIATTAYVVGQGYLKSADAASTYLTQANAASTYLTQSSASSTYLTISNASSTYLTQANAASTYLTQANAASNYMSVTTDQTVSAVHTFSNGIRFSDTTTQTTAFNRSGWSNTGAVNISGNTLGSTLSLSSVSSSLTYNSNQFTINNTGFLLTADAGDFFNVRAQSIFENSVFIENATNYNNTLVVGSQTAYAGAQGTLMVRQNGAVATTDQSNISLIDSAGTERWRVAARNGGLLAFFTPAVNNVLTVFPNGLGAGVSVGALNTVTTPTLPLNRAVPVFARRKTADQTIPQVTDTTVTFETAYTEIENYSSLAGITYSNGTFTNTSGATRTFSIYYQVIFAANQTGSRVAWIRTNGQNGRRFAMNLVNAVSGDGTALTGTSTITLANNEFFDIRVYQAGVNGGLNIPGTTSISGNDIGYASHISITWL